jgi:hypothetical protein
LPPGETFDRSFFADIVLDSLKKKFAQIPDPNSEKGHFVPLDNARANLAEHEIQSNNLTRLSHRASSSDLGPADFWCFGYLKVMLEGSLFEPAEELQEKVTDILASIPTPTFRAVFNEWKTRFLRCIETFHTRDGIGAMTHLRSETRLGFGIWFESQFVFVLSLASDPLRRIVSYFPPALDTFLVTSPVNIAAVKADSTTLR